MFLSCFFSFFLHSAQVAIPHQRRSLAQTSEGSTKDSLPLMAPHNQPSPKSTHHPNDPSSYVSSQQYSGKVPTTAAQNSSANLDQYYCQRIETLKNLQNKALNEKNAEACSLLAAALSKWIDPDDDDECAAAIERLQTWAKEKEEKPDNFLSPDDSQSKIEEYQKQITEGKKNGVEAFCEELKEIAPYTAYTMLTRYHNQFGSTEAANKSARRYDQINKELIGFLRELINKVNNPIS